MPDNRGSIGEGPIHRLDRDRDPIGRELRGVGKRIRVIAKPGRTLKHDLAVG
jgi:hypothetical protein